MSYLYLDHNIYIYMSQELSIKKKISMLKDYGIQCVYSPAHIEEIHVANIQNTAGDYTCTVKKLFSLISDITDDLECLPTLSMGVIVKSESPIQCYKRVKQMDTITRVQNDSEIKFELDKKHYRDMVQMDKHNTNISTLSSEEVWLYPVIAQTIKNFNQNIDAVIQQYNSSKEVIICALVGIDKTLPESYRLLQGGYKIFKNSHKQLEFSIEILFRILNQNGYNAEKSLGKTISGTHDISHAIYATAAKWLFTTDSRFYAKCKAVYSFLEIPTEVVLCKPNTIIESLDSLLTNRN